MSADYTANRSHAQKIKTEETHELEIGLELIFKLVGGKERWRHPKTMMEAI